MEEDKKILDQLEEWERGMVGKTGLPWDKVRDSFSRGRRNSRDAIEKNDRRRAQDRVKRNEPSLPKLKCLDKADER